MPRPDGWREPQGLTQVDFARLSEWLDDGRDSHGQAVPEMRRRLVSYFDRRTRGSATALADETLNRVGLALQDAGTMAGTSPGRYCYATARAVLLKDGRRARLVVDVDDAPGANADGELRPGAPDALVVIRERRFACLRRCLGTLAPEQRELAVDYYRHEDRQQNGRRREMADRLGIPIAALSIRACRIRQSLAACVEACHQES
jgi:DNA-directed RNA polymerase specialized sigma24 family protein